MKTTAKVSDKLYQNLGRLFYAIAFADGKIHEKEFAELKKLIRNDWAGNDNSLDEFGSDAVYQMETVFDWLWAEEMPVNSSMQAFTEYYQNNSAAITPAIRDRIWKSACAIASAYAGRNKSELVVLDRLRAVMKPGA